MEVKRRVFVWFWLLTFATLGLALSAPLPDKAPYTNPVTVRSAGAMSLEEALRAGARAAGVRLLTKDLPGVQVAVDFKQVPFKSFLDLLLRIYAPDHGYALLPEGVVVVAPKETLRGLVPETAKDSAKKGEASGAAASVAVSVAPLGESAVEAAKKLGVEAAYVPEARAVVLSGQADKVAAAAALLRELAAQAQRNAPAPPPPPEVPEEARLLVRLPEGLPAAEALQLAEALGLKAVALKSSGVVFVQGNPEALEVFRKGIGEAAAAGVQTGTAKKEKAWTVLAFEAPPGMSTDALASALKSLFPEGVFSPVGGVVSARVPEDQAAEVQKVVERLRASAKPTPGTVVLTFAVPEGVEAGKVLEAVRALYPEAKAAAAGNVVLVEVPADQAPAAKEAVSVAVEELAKAASFQRQRQERAPAALYPVKGYPIYGEPEDIAAALKGLFPPGYLEAIGASVQVLPKQKAVVVAAPYEVHKAVVDLLRAVDPPKGEEAAGSGGKEKSVRLVLSRLKPDQVGPYLEAAGVEASVVLEPSGEAVWIRGKPDQVDRALFLLKLADKNPPQVRVAVRVVQMERSALEQLSGEVRSALQGLDLNLGGGGGGLGYALPQSIARLLSLNLSALESKGLAKTLLNTEVLALDGEEVALNSGGTLYVLTQSAGNAGQGDGAAAQTQGVTQIEYGLVMKITPRVVPDPLGATMRVVLELGNLPTGGPISGTIDISKRKLEGTLRLRSGETGLIGGLIQEEERNEEGGVPILKDVPLLGALFRSSEKRRTERVVLIMLTPNVVDYGQAAVSSLPEGGEPSAPPAPPEDPRNPPEPPKGPGEGAERTGTLSGGTTAFSAADLSRPILPDLPPPSPDYSGQAYVTEKGAALYVLGGRTTPVAKLVAAYLVRTDREGKPVSALAVPFQASHAAFGAGSMAVVSLQASPEALAAADQVVLVVEDELGKPWSVVLPLPAEKEGR